ncbi:hypothetical protein B0T11DRAFT_326608 [Plectosphaerella cucumerina]|uniref:Heterokaryon incompatibility domain-containing protein n=1 Tax=Plectosphaerella cucumerina TaxID=40658 RepID=A0A8K0TKE6_9PEZI|nr:hypothetical protein B0T11DRAFT_326608 [Plectosphaerella cucumerina]
MTPERAASAILTLAQKKITRQESTLSEAELKLLDLYAQHGRKSDDFTGPVLEAVRLLLQEEEHCMARCFVDRNAAKLDPKHLQQLFAMAIKAPWNPSSDGFDSLARRLIQLGMPNGLDHDGNLPLYYACRHGRADIFATLVEAGADLEATCDDILPIDDTCPTPRCNLLKLTLDAKYFGFKFDWTFECGWGTSFDRQWDPIINTFLSQGMAFDPGHPLIAYHLQTACTQGRSDIVDLILKPGDKAFQTLLADNAMVTGLALPAALESAARAGQSAIIEKLVALGADPRTPFPAGTIVPAPFEAKRLFKKGPVSPLAGPSWMLSYRYPEDYNWDGVAQSLELMVIVGEKQPEDAAFNEECAKILQGCITHGHVVPAGHLLDRGLRPLAITKCTSPAGLDLCVQRDISSLLNWRSVLDDACREGHAEVLRAVVKHTGPGIWKNKNELLQYARRARNKPDLFCCFIEHCGLEIDYVGKASLFSEEDSSLLASAIKDIHTDRTAAHIQLMVSLGASTEMPGLPYDAREAMWKSTEDGNWQRTVESFRSYFLPALRAVYGEEMPYPPGWPHQAQDAEARFQEKQQSQKQKPSSYNRPDGIDSEADDSFTPISKLASRPRPYQEVPEQRQFSNTMPTQPQCSYLDRDVLKGLDGVPFPFASLGGFPDGIRLIRIDPATKADAPLQCSFIRCSLAEAPTFQILTGCWNITSVLESIDVEDIQAMVHADLAIALRRVRYPTSTMVLWIREICINYRDVEETNKQMTLIRNIHLDAQRHLVWLGEDTDDANLVFDFLDQPAPEPQDTSPRRHVEPEDGDDSDVESVESEETDESSCYPEETKAAYERLCHRPWFYLPWTETEVFLCNKMSILCGCHELTIAGSPLARLVRPYRSYISESEAVPPHCPPSRPPTGPEHLSNLSECFYELDWYSDPVNCARRIANRLAWDPSTRLDPRECAFATASLSAEPPFVIDYWDSMAAILRKITEAALDDELNILLHFGFNNKVVQGLPSWVPDLTHPEEITAFYSDTASGGQFSKFDFKGPRVDGDQLILPGLCVERILAVGAVMQDSDPVAMQRVLHNWESVAVSMSHGSIVDFITDGFLQTLVASTASRRLFDVKTSMRWYDLHGSGALRDADSEWFETCKLAEAWFGLSHRQRDDTYVANMNKNNLDRYEGQVWTMGRGRRFFVTERGNMGLAPLDAKPGDVVMHPLTAKMMQPFQYVLSQRLDGTYGLVGAACLFVADVPERFKKGELSPVDFVIR